MKKLIMMIFLVFANFASTASPQFLDFPVSGYGPYSPGLITSVLDHGVPHDLNPVNGLIPFKTYTDSGPFGYNGVVLSFTGELFSQNTSYPMSNLGCYPKTQTTNQSPGWNNVLKNAYVGTSGCGSLVALNYDNHPGYDYLIFGQPVYPAASGSIIGVKCIKTFANNGACEDYGAVAIDHGNGFVTQYLHMKNVYYGTAVNGQSQPVLGNKVTSIGTVSNTSPVSVPTHLHFEVLQRKSVPVKSEYYHRSNYVIVDPYGYNPVSYYADKLLSKPGCLWKVGCQY